jgi:site-specific recombinase XerC
MIERSNWLAVKRYLSYCADVEQNAPATVATKRSQLRHLLEWAGETAFADVPDKRPTFPKYLLSAGNSNKPGTMIGETMHRICWTVRAFLRWLRSEDPKRYPKLTEAWLRGIEAPKVAGDVKDREVFSLDDVLKIVRTEGGTLYDVRSRAAVAFLFLSAMRAGAFVTLPISAVDLDANEIKQFPSLGVHTKNTKAAKTHLLPIPELRAVVKEWDTLVRSSLPAGEPWFASMDHDSTHVTLTASQNRSRSREHSLADSVRRACERAGVKYLSPHKLRHGYAVYAIQRAATLADLKAVSQDMMHASMATTDGIYATLTGVQVGDRIATLGPAGNGGAGGAGNTELSSEDLRLARIIREVMKAEGKL